MNKLDEQYRGILAELLYNGREKGDRTGTGTLSKFGMQIRHNMKDGFPLLTTKKMAVKTMMTELKWFLKGDTNIKYLVDNNCNIWNGDAYKKYHQAFPETEMLSQEQFITLIKTNDEFAEKWGELGPIYGKQWRDWDEDTGVKIDQISNLIEQIKTNPDSRRLMVNAWNVGELDQMVLPPCHYGFQVYTRELSLEERVNIFNSKMISQGIRTQIATVDVDESYWRKSLEETKHDIPTRAISLMYNARSQDVPLGTPFNIASYALLLEIIGKMVNMVPDELIGNLGDTHIYKNQIDGVKEQLTREPYPLPKLEIGDNINFDGTIDDFVNSCLISDFQIIEYETHPTIKIPLSN